MEQNTNKVGKHSAPQQVQGESFFRRLLKKPGVQSFLAALLCIVIGLVVGYIVLLAIEPSGASKAIGAVLKNFLARRTSDFCHRLVYHGREICTARTAPHCDRCCLNDVCKKNIK